MSGALVLGASGAVGGFLLQALIAEGMPVLAVSRSRRPARPGLTWLEGDLGGAMPDWPAGAPRVVFSAGPLDLFAHWLAGLHATPGLHCVVALGSTSIGSKPGSPLAGEREVAARLAAAETRLQEACARLGVRLVILRPTLIYGAGTDRSLSPLARSAWRWRVFPRLLGHTGLRQPVHAADLAQACLAAARIRAPATVYELGGGERLPLAVMLERVRRSLPGTVLPLPVPAPFLRWAAHGPLLPAARGFVARLDTDLVCDNGPAHRDLGWQPRGFRPTAQMWGLPAGADRE